MLSRVPIFEILRLSPAHPSWLGLITVGVLATASWALVLVYWLPHMLFDLGSHMYRFEDDLILWEPSNLSITLIAGVIYGASVICAGYLIVILDPYEPRPKNGEFNYEAENEFLEEYKTHLIDPAYKSDAFQYLVQAAQKVNRINEIRVATHSFLLGLAAWRLVVTRDEYGFVFVVPMTLIVMKGLDVLAKDYLQGRSDSLLGVGQKVIEDLE